MNPKKIALLLLVPLILGPLATQAATPLTYDEYFEDDTVGANPSDPDITYTEGTTNNPNLAGINVASGGLDGSSKKFGFQSSGGSGGQYARFDANDPQQFTSVEFYLHTGSQANHLTRIGFYDSSNKWVLDVEAITDKVRVGLNGDQDPPFPTYVVNDGNNHAVKVTFNWGAKTWSWYTDGVLQHTESFVDTTATDMKRIQISRIFSNPAHLDIDAIEFINSAISIPDPPTSLSGVVEVVGGPSTTGEVVLTWPVSADDPDQINGSLTYNVYDQVGFVSSTTTKATDGFQTYTYQYGGTPPFGQFTFYITVNDTGTPESVASCSITLNLDNLDDSNVCGSDFEVPQPPTGLNALVVQQVTASTGQVDLRFPVSPNDPDQTLGAFEYTALVEGISAGPDSIDAEDGDGFRHIRVLLTDPTPGTVKFNVIATNTTSGLSSSLSCSVFIDVSDRFNVGACGTMQEPGVPGGAGGGPLFDIQPLVDASGASASAIGWVAGIAITIGLAFGGVFYFGPLGGLAGGALGIGFATAVGWFPLWFIVFVVLLLAGAFVAFRGQ